ncbi:hypothetical protein HDU91_005564 [Kappamyces sp. JEL0680]|nr:hypothetical protein HDU91_005564 [Kappamyces sp. JEL0680]
MSRILVFGANARVGKTLLAAGLCKSKPGSFYARLGNKLDDLETVQRFAPATRLLQDDSVRCPSVQFKSLETSPDPGPAMVVETDQSILSLRNGLPQAHQLRHFRVPTVIVGDPAAQGLSSTLMAYEALADRGFPVKAIAIYSPLFKDPLEKFVTVPVLVLDAPKPQKDDPLLDYTSALLHFDGMEPTYKDIWTLCQYSNHLTAGDKKIYNEKLDFKEKASPKVGSTEQLHHKPGGGMLHTSS